MSVIYNEDNGFVAWHNIGNIIWEDETTYVWVSPQLWYVGMNKMAYAVRNL